MMRAHAYLATHRSGGQRRVSTLLPGDAALLPLAGPAALVHALAGRQLGASRKAG
jgi:hypothetical protein